MAGRAPPDADLKAYLAGQHVGNQPWCAAFVNASLTRAAMKGSGSNLAKSFLNWGQHVDAANVRAGDVAVMSRGGGSPYGGGMQGHVGLVTGSMQGGRVPTIEGNVGHRVKHSFEGLQAEYRRYDGMGRATPAGPLGKAYAAAAGGGGGVGGAIDACRGAVTGLQSNGILGMLMGTQGAGSVISGMLGGLKGGVNAGGILGGLFGGDLGGTGGLAFAGHGGGGIKGFLGGAIGLAGAGLMTHKVEGEHALHVKFQNAPGKMNTTAQLGRGFKQLKVSQFNMAPTAKDEWDGDTYSPA
jgi:uncharacterized protein (TIGR02594 family)